MDEHEITRIETCEATPQDARTGAADDPRAHGFWDRAADFLLSLPAGIGVRLGG